MSSLLLRLPAHAIAVGNADRDLSRLPCAFALRTRHDAIEREGYATLAELAAHIKNTRQLVVLVAAADVTLLRMSVPPLSAAKLRAALPNLVEEKLLGDVADCVVVAAPVVNGLRTVAVMQRAWLTQIIQTLRGLGAQHISALPEQLCLAQHDGQVTAAISEYGDDCALALRLSEHEGLGIVQNSPAEILQSLHCLVPASAITLYVPPAALSRYQTLLAQDERITVSADNGTHWPVPNVRLDLTAGLGMQHQFQWDWRPWRWALALAILLLLVNTAALNFDWWRINHEAVNLRASMKHIYLATYPKESVILDPLLQMQQKIAAARHHAGKSASDDFTTLAAEFGLAWTGAMPATTITAIEYRERALWIHLKSAVPSTPIKSALAGRKLSLESARDSELVWQIRSVK